MRKFWSRVWSGWKKIAHAIGVFQTKVILFVLYFVVIGIASLLIRLGRKDLLDRTIDDAGSLWRDRVNMPVDLENARRQF